MDNLRDGLVAGLPQNGRLGKCYTSNYMKLYYTVLTVLCVVGLVWACIHIGYLPRAIWFIVAELLLYSLILVDLALRLYAYGCHRFFRHWLNIADTALSVACVLAVVVTVTISTYYYDVEDIVVSLLFICRNVVLLLRTMVLIARHRVKKRRRESVESEESSPDLLEQRLAQNREILQYLYKARMATLCEVEEKYESTSSIASPRWKEQYGHLDTSAVNISFTDEIEEVDE